MTRRSAAFASLATVAALAATPLAAARAAEAGNVVGGGTATISGGGDDVVITYSAGGAGGGGGGGGGGGLSQPGRIARFASGQGEGGPGLEYLTPAPVDPGREAWLLGGGDNAEVVYDRRR